MATRLMLEIRTRRKPVEYLWTQAISEKQAEGLIRFFRTRLLRDVPLMFLAKLEERRPIARDLRRRRAVPK